MAQRHDLRSQMQVAKRTGLSQSSIGRVIRGEVNPSASALSSIAAAFGVEMGDLYSPPDEFAAKYMDEHQRGMNALQAATDSIKLLADRHAKGLVPLLTWKQVASGGKLDPIDWVVCPTLHSLDTYALSVKGLGMFDPAGSISFQEGDRIFVDPRAQPEHRSIVVVRIGNSEEATFRQIIAEGGQWLLLQLNPSWPSRVSPLSADDAVLGTVIAKVQTFASDRALPEGTPNHQPPK